MTQKPSTEVLSLEARNAKWEATGFVYKPANEEQIARLNVAQLWGLQAQLNTDLQTNQAWELRAIIEDSNNRFAIIEIAPDAVNSAQQFGRFREGEILPNGATLLKIYKDRVEYEIASGVNTKRLYE
jgi:hypothetical protein